MAGVRASRWSRVILVASLALNLLVVGLILGMVLSHMRRDDDRRDRADAALRDIGNVPFVMALTPEDRKALFAGLGGEGRGQAFRDNRERLRVRFESVLALLRAEDFDAEALRRMLADQRAALFERQQLGEDLLVERLAAMTPEARVAYADRLDRSLRRTPRRAGRP